MQEHSHRPNSCAQVRQVIRTSHCTARWPLCGSSRGLEHPHSTQDTRLQARQAAHPPTQCCHSCRRQHAVAPGAFIYSSLLAFVNALVLVDHSYLSRHTTPCCTTSSAPFNPRQARPICVNANTVHVSACPLGKPPLCHIIQCRPPIFALLAMANSWCFEVDLLCVRLPHTALLDRPHIERSSSSFHAQRSPPTARFVLSTSKASQALLLLSRPLLLTE